jgi:hypothetical protein
MPLSRYNQGSAAVKKTDMEKLKGLKIASGVNQGVAKKAYGQAAPVVLSRREQRKIDAAQGLIPFAVKLETELVKRLQTLAQERQTGLTEVVTEALKKGLGD